MHTSFPYKLNRIYTKGLKEGKEGMVKEEGVVAGHLEVEMRPRK